MNLSRKIFTLLCLTMIPLTLISCAGVNAGVKPLTAERPRDEAFRTELHKELSSLNITVETTAKDLSDTLNRLTPKSLYKGSTATRGLSADILRNGPIVVNAADNYLYLSIPISVTLSYSMFEAPAIATRLSFRLNPRVTTDWKVNADVQYTGLSDLMAEKIGIGPLTLKPRSIVEGVIQPLQKPLADLINQKLNEKFSLKAEVAKVWNSAQKPILLDKNYSAWLTMTPREVMLYPLSARDNRVQVSVGLQSYAEVVVGPAPPVRPVTPLPNLKLMNGADRTFRVALHTDLFYKDILTIAAPLLLNKEFGSDGKSIILQELDLYGNGDRLVIKAKTTGSLDGVIYLTCRPVFNPQTNVFAVEDVDFDLQTQSLLLQSADWFLHGSIRSTIQEKLNMDLTQRLVQTRELAGRALARVKLANNVLLTGTVKTMKLNDVMVQKEKLSIQVYTEGEAAVVIH
jgi:hypothetical protein